MLLQVTIKLPPHKTPKHNTSLTSSRIPPADIPTQYTSPRTTKTTLLHLLILLITGQPRILDISSLPPEIIITIARNLELQDIISLSRVCIAFNFLPNLRDLRENAFFLTITQPTLTAHDILSIPPHTYDTATIDAAHFYLTHTATSCTSLTPSDIYTMTETIDSATRQVYRNAPHILICGQFDLDIVYNENRFPACCFIRDGHFTNHLPFSMCCCPLINFHTH